MLTLKVRPLSVAAVLMLMSASVLHNALAQTGGGGAGGAAGGAGGAAGGAAGAAGGAAGAAGSAAGSAGSSAGSAASGAGSAASGAAGTAGSAATGAMGTASNAVSGALSNASSALSGALGTTGLGVGSGPKAAAAHRKAVLARFAEEGALEQRNVRRRCVDVLRYPAEYELALVDLCRILRTTSRR